MSRSSRFAGVTRVEVVTLFGVAFVFLALGLPAADSALDVSRRIQCTNNLKYIGLGMHNFHDTFNGIPPLTIGEKRASFFVHLYPFAEQSNIYNLLNGGNASMDTVFSAPVVDNWKKLSAEEQKAAANVFWMHCSARRPAKKPQSTSSEDPEYQGPVGDFAVVFIDSDLDEKGMPKAAGEWAKHTNNCDKAQVEMQKGAARLATIPCTPPDFKVWKPRDTFARITDGTSNTLIVGEKHLRSTETRKYSAEMNQQDGVYWFEADKGREYSVARNIRLPLAKGATAFNKAGEGPDKSFSFGGMHPGAALFLRGDGSVAPIAFDIAQAVLNRLGHCSDGGKIELPGF